MCDYRVLFFRIILVIIFAAMVIFFVHFFCSFFVHVLFMFCSFVVHFLFMFCSCLVHVLFTWTQHGDVSCIEGRAQRHDDPIMIGYVLGAQPSWDAIGWREHDGPTDLDADDKERLRLQHKDNALRAHFRRSPPRRRAGTLPAGRQCSAERRAEPPKVGISRVLVKASPAFGRRRFYTDTDCTVFARRCS